METNRLADLISGLDLGAVHRAIEEAYRRGLEDGEVKLKDSVLKALSASPLPSGTPPPIEDDEESDPSKRAPRGLTRGIIFSMLKRYGGLTMAQIQEMAVAADARVSPKTVYNELKREDGTLYRELGGLWGLIGDRPVEAANHSVAASEDLTAFD